MKKLMAILLSLSFLLSAAACGADKGEEQGETTWAKDWGITLTAQDVTSTGMTLVCTQRGGIAEGSLETGSEYWLEKNENDIWVKVQPLVDPVWDMMVHLIHSDKTMEWELDWSWLYGELGAGTYRICKTVMEFKASGASESQLYCAEFEIKG